MASVKSWCAVCQYPGKANFVLGTVVARQNAPMHEIEPRIYDLMDKLFPTRPALVNVIPGAVIFAPEGESHGE